MWFSLSLFNPAFDRYALASPTDHLLLIRFMYANKLAVLRWSNVILVGISFTITGVAASVIVVSEVDIISVPSVPDADDAKGGGIV